MPQTIYIRCENNAGQMLQYDTRTGHYVVVKRENASLDECDNAFPGEPFSQGYYIVHDNSVIAVVPSVQGPLLLLGDQKYSLVEQDITFELGDAEEGYINTFKIFLDGKEIYATDYERPYSDYWAFTEPEAVDFFYWLNLYWSNHGLRAPELVRCLTLPQGQGFEAETAEQPMQELPLADPGDSLIRQPLLPHSYPWYLQLLALVTFCTWIFSLKPAWSYIPAAVNLTRGEFYLEQGKYGLAILALSQALDAVPSAKKTKISLSVAFFRNENYTLGLGILNGIKLEGMDWERVKAVLPESYRDQFVEVKKK